MDRACVENFTESNLKKTLINFERKCSENQKLRIKHVESPTKFATSETDLFAALDEIQGVAAQPELYPVLLAKNTIDHFLSLISHDNTDISAKVIGILQELTDIDESSDQEPSEKLIEALISKNIIDIIVSNLSRLDRDIKDESQAIINTLSMIENFIEYDLEVATIGSHILVPWMMNSLNDKIEFDSVKLAITELLSILLMRSNENKLHLNQVNGIDTLLQQAAYYRRIAPQTGEEHEFLEQTINCLCTAILHCDENRESFYNEEGVDLIELILREKRESVKKSNLKISMLKLFNHVLTTDKNHDEVVTQCCERFIDILGLRVIFPLFNNPKLVLNERVRKKEYHQFLDEVEEHTTSMILALLKHSQNSEHIQRILVKFAEANFEKFKRLLALHDKYFKIVQIGGSNNDGDSTTSSALFTLRAVDYLILLVAYMTNQFETYDPNSGETFSNYVLKTLAEYPQLRHQLLMGTRRHIKEVADTKEEQDSLKILLEHFESLGKSVKHNVNGDEELRSD